MCCPSFRSLPIALHTNRDTGSSSSLDIAPYLVSKEYARHRFTIYFSRMSLKSVLNSRYIKTDEAKF